MPAPKKHPPYPGCETGGRPLKYTKEFIEKEADEFLKWLQQPLNVYFKKFALERGYHPQRLSEFAEQNQKFSDVYRMAQAWQEAKLVDGGLNNIYNAGFTKFVMGNTCGWTDKQQVSGDAINPLSILLQKVDGSSKDLISKNE